MTPKNCEPFYDLGSCTPACETQLFRTMNLNTEAISKEDTE